MLSDKNLLLRAAWITLIIALVGVGVLYAVIEAADAEKPELLDIDWFHDDGAAEGNVGVEGQNQTVTTASITGKSAAAKGEI